MKVIVAAWREFVGLFVDDGWLALSIVGLVALTGLLSLVPGAAGVAGGVLLLGCLGALMLNVVRSAQR